MPNGVSNTSDCHRIGRWRVERSGGQAETGPLSGDDNRCWTGWAKPFWISDLEDRDQWHSERVGDVHRAAIVADEDIAARNDRHQLAHARAHDEYGLGPVPWIRVAGTQHYNVASAKLFTQRT